MSEEQIGALQERSGRKPEGAGAVAGAGVDDESLPRIPETLSILPVRGFVVFPGTIVPLNVQRPASIKLLDETLPLTKVVGLLTQRDETKEDPEPQDLYHVGTAALVLTVLGQGDEQVVVLGRGVGRLCFGTT